MAQSSYSTLYGRAGAVSKPYLLCLLVCLCIAASGCSQRPFRPGGDDAMAFIARAVESREDSITLRAALPSAEEVEALTGLALHEQGIQPLWLEVRNDSSEWLRAALWSIDRDYFSPAEVAYMNRGHFSAEGHRALERWMIDTALPRRIPTGESASGFLYTNLTPGTKGFNFDLFSASSSYNFTLFVDQPGFTPDYRLVDFRNIYGADEVVDVAATGAGAFFADALPCCATGPDGTAPGLPLNLVLVGSGEALKRGLMRGEWRETIAESRQAVTRGANFFDGRVADGRFFKIRDEGRTRLVLDIWLTRWRIDGSPVWVAQTYFYEEDSALVAALRRGAEAVDRTELLTRFLGESVSADLDSARAFAMQNFWYNQSVIRGGFAPGVDRRGEDNPGRTFDGLGYMTKGDRGVLFLSETPTAFGASHFVVYEGLQQRPPQSGGAP